MDEAPETAGKILESMADAEPEAVQKMIDKLEKLGRACQAALRLKRHGKKISTINVMLVALLSQDDGENE